MRLDAPTNDVRCEVKYKDQTEWKGRTLLTIGRTAHEFWGTFSDNLHPIVSRIDDFDFRTIEAEPGPRPEWNLIKECIPNEDEVVVVFHNNDWEFAQFENNAWNLFEKGFVRCEDIEVWSRIPFIPGKKEKR
jgi:hypothetical protein